MANKNTRQLRIKIARASRNHEDSVTHDKPIYNYHSAGDFQDFRSRPGSFFTTQTFPTAVVKGDGVNSINRKRNSCQRIYLNKGENSGSNSLTAHEAFLRNEHMTWKGHKYIEYRRIDVPTVSQPTVESSD
jgi:hypothetical protein